MRRIADSFVQAFKGMFRNGIVTFVSIFVLISCLVFVGSFALISVNIDYNLSEITELNEIEVFLDYDLDDAAALDIQKQIEALDNVTRTEFTSKEEGLEEVRDKFTGWEEVLDNISEEENPIPYRIRVFYADNAEVTSLDYDLKAIEGVRSVNSRFDIAASIESLQNGISMVFVWFTVLCTVVCMFVIVNTIKLSVYSRREENTIMRYIGASRSYIAAPFVLEGAFIGIIGAVCAFFIEKLIYSALMGFVAEEMGMVKLYAFAEKSPMLLAIFLGIALFTGVVGSLVSLGKYVEV